MTFTYQSSLYRDTVGQIWKIPLLNPETNACFPTSPLIFTKYDNTDLAVFTQLQLNFFLYNFYKNSNASFTVGLKQLLHLLLQKLVHFWITVAYRLLVDPLHFLELDPHNRHAVKVIFNFSQSRSFRIIRGKFTSSSKRLVYHAWVGHTGTITTPSALSFWIFWSTQLMSL